MLLTSASALARFLAIIIFSLHCSVGIAEPAPADLSDRINTTQDADELYALAVTALASDQPQLAQEALERVVTKRPRFAGAWLDLALAAYRSGDRVAALEHLEYLRSQFSLPPALAAQIAHWHRLWQSPQAPAATRSWQGEISLSIGYDNNVNAGTSSRIFPLSLPEGSVLLSVDDNFLPHADRFNLLNIATWGPAQSLGSGKISPFLLLRRKQFTRQHDYSSLDIQPGLIYQQPTGENGSWQIALFVQHYRLGDAPLFNDQRLAVQRTYFGQKCRLTAGGEIEARQHQRIANLSGTFYSLSGSLGCRLPGNGNLGATIKGIREQAHKERPGGSNQGGEFLLTYDQPLGNSRRLQVGWQISRLNDQEGYSPLLENNAARHLERQTLYLSLRQALSAQWEARLNIEQIQQSSNLPIFQQKGNLIMLALVRTLGT